jgi:hypothetical protein
MPRKDPGIMSAPGFLMNIPTGNFPEETITLAFGEKFPAVSCGRVTDPLPGRMS